MRAASLPHRLLSTPALTLTPALALAPALAPALVLTLALFLTSGVRPRVHSLAWTLRDLVSPPTTVGSSVTESWAVCRICDSDDPTACYDAGVSYFECFTEAACRTAEVACYDEYAALESECYYASYYAGEESQ